MFDKIKKFFQKIFSKKSDERIIEPIIPEHRKKQLNNVEQIKTSPNQNNTEELVSFNKQNPSNVKLVDLKLNTRNNCLFKINSVYNVGPTQMITGFIEVGLLKKGMKTLVNQTQITVIEVRKKLEKVDELKAGDEGTIVIKSRKNPLIKQDDYLDFS